MATDHDEPTRTLVYEIEDEDHSRNFYVTPEGGMSVDGPGSLDNLLVITDSDSFGVRVETEDATLVDDSFDRLSTFSDDLGHVDARTTGSGDSAISVTDFPYRSSVRAQVLVTEPLTVQWVRAVYTVGREADY